MMAQITGLYAALLAILFLILTVRIIIYRRGQQIGLGDGDDPIMRQRIRAHGNFAEFAPFGLLLILIAEVQGTAGVWLHLCGLMLLAGRILHGVNFSFGLRKMPLRVGGMVLTMLSIALAAVLALPV